MLPFREGKKRHLLSFREGKEGIEDNKGICSHLENMRFRRPFFLRVDDVIDPLESVDLVTSRRSD